VSLKIFIYFIYPINLLLQVITFFGPLCTVVMSQYSIWYGPSSAYIGLGIVCAKYFNYLCRRSSKRWL